MSCVSIKQEWEYFLNNMFFPLYSFIQPCRSLCLAVKDSCAPVLACQGHEWPEALDCDRFPVEEDMCITPYTKFSQFGKGKDKLSTTISKVCIFVYYYTSFLK